MCDAVQNGKRCRHTSPHARHQGEFRLPNGQWEEDWPNAEYEEPAEATAQVANGSISQTLMDMHNRVPVEEHNEPVSLSDPDAPHTQLRHGARETEIAAALAALPNSGTARRRVLDIIAGSEGLTDYEIRGLDVERHGTPNHQLESLRTRRKELEDGGWVIDSGLRRPTPSNNEANVWVLSDRARSELGRDNFMLHNFD